MFDLILADPPWKYNFSRSRSRKVENQYPTMTPSAIKALPVGGLANENSVLYLWATAPKLELALEVMKAWGFKYTTNAVWDKKRIGMGYYFRGRHEHLLIGKRGAYPVPTPGVRVASIIEEARGSHSSKPEQVYVILERMYPNAKKIELFARGGREGWATWGEEAEGGIKWPTEKRPS